MSQMAALVRKYRDTVDNLQSWAHRNNVNTMSTLIVSITRVFEDAANSLPLSEKKIHNANVCRILGKVASLVPSDGTPNLEHDSVDIFLANELSQSTRSIIKVQYHEIFHKQLIIEHQWYFKLNETNANE